MKENLRTTKFKNGSVIPLVSDQTSWSNQTSSAYCWYNNNASTYGSTYGALYNWYSASSGNLCPDGWHVPSDAEWTTLTNFLGGMDIAGGKMKESGYAHWVNPNTGANNASNFTGLPGSFRDEIGAFDRIIGQYGFWWSTTENGTTNAWDRGLFYDSNSTARGDGVKKNGISIRCLKN
jgi:uncharacterized protein (TIGR02145 family)